MARMTSRSNVAQLFDALTPRATPEDVRVAEAMVFASAEPLDEAAIAARLSDGADVGAVMEELRRLYAGRGVNLVRVARRWTFRTAEDLSWLLAREDDNKRKLSRAAIETLAIVAYHQPVTRADIEDPWRGGVQGSARRSHGGRLGEDARPAEGPRTADHLWHDDRVPSSVRARRDRRLPGLDELQAAGLFDVGEAVVSCNGGSGLLRDLPKIREIFDEVRKAVSIPFTVKFRMGWNDSNIVCVELAKMAEDCGLNAVALHARTREQGYQGDARWEWIAAVKDAVTFR